jgi:hypothetical protein
MYVQRRNPGYPLRPLGYLGVSAPQAIGAAAPIASAGIGSITALGSFAGPIGAGVGALVGIIASLWSGHRARAAGARSENEATNSAVQAFDASLKAVFDAANKGTITSSDAMRACQQILQNYWIGMAPYTSGPGRKDSSGGGSNCGYWMWPGIKADWALCGVKGTPGVNQSNGIPGKDCTAGCALGCMGLMPTIQHAILIFQQGGGSFNVCPVYGNSKYGSVPRAPYTLTYTPPPPPAAVASAAVGAAASSVAAAASSAAATVTAEAKKSVGGFPVWMWLAAAGGLYFATR